MTLKIHGKLKFIGSIYYFKKLARGTHGSEGFQITITMNLNNRNMSITIIKFIYHDKTDQTIEVLLNW
jgi:hypothetical protein